MKSKFLPILKSLIFVLAYGYLIYKIVNFFTHYDLSQADFSFSWKSVLYLLFVLILLPINWGIETFKWQLLIKKIQNISFIQALKSVLIGLFIGFFTPQRIGEIPGRVLTLNSSNRTAGMSMMLVGSIIQTIINSSMGLIGLSFLSLSWLNHRWATIWSISIIFLLLSMLLFLPTIANYLKSKFSNEKIKNVCCSLSKISSKDLAKLFFITLLRYIIYSTQFYLCIRFCHINISLSEAAIAISCIYLFITITPSFAIADAGLRGSYALVFIGLYSSQTINIATAGISVWCINVVIPMIIGSIMMKDIK